MKVLKFISTIMFVFCLSFNNLGTKELNSTIKEANKLKVEVLLIGTSHWNNFEQKGSNIAQSNQIDIPSRTISHNFSISLKEL